MKFKKTLVVIGIIILIGTASFVAYLIGLASAYDLNKPDKRPFFIISEPVIVKNIQLPKGTKIIYEKRYFWQEYEQEKQLSEKDIVAISFPKETTINWGGVPITSIVKFYNSEMSGYTVTASFKKLNKNAESRFANLWQSCNDDLGITVKNTNDWSFNKENILDVQSCGVNYQRYFKDDIAQQKYLDSLHDALIEINH